jgi:hypothetical protein
LRALRVQRGSVADGLLSAMRIKDRAGLFVVAGRCFLCSPARCPFYLLCPIDFYAVGPPLGLLCSSRAIHSVPCLRGFAVRRFRCGIDACMVARHYICCRLCSSSAALSRVAAGNSLGHALDRRTRLVCVSLRSGDGAPRNIIRRRLGARRRGRRMKAGIGTGRRKGRRRKGRRKGGEERGHPGEERGHPGEERGHPGTSRFS